MDNLYGEWYQEFHEYIEIFGEEEVYSALESLLRASRNSFGLSKRLMEKVIDVSWVEAIENGLLHLDNVLRTPRRTIEDVEEIVPIALSRKITVESVKHLAQHTDLIQNIDKKTGKITPSKILNIHKEESLLTYENKFVNTLVDRLYIFINRRYEKLAQVAKDEEVFSLSYDTELDDGSGGKMKLQMKLESVESLAATDASGMTVWQRVNKLKKAIEGYKGSELCQKLGSNFIRPPVMRTNAIMKNVDLKACLTLWQYIESYDKVGYEINVQDTVLKPQNGYIDDFYKIMVLNLLLFRTYMSADTAEKIESIKAQKLKPAAPKIIKKYSKELAPDYSVSTEAVAGYVAEDGELRIEQKMPANVQQLFGEINEVIAIESAYLDEQEKKRRAEAERRAEEEARLLEQQRIEEERQAELERIRQKQEEDRRIVEEMLAKKRAEQEAAERERQREEAERLARLEELRRLEEEARLKREEEERIAAERERIQKNKEMARAELGEAEGMDAESLPQEPDEAALEQEAYASVTEEEIEEAKSAMTESGADAREEMEDPRAVAARMKLEQQKREKERAEAERAQRLKAERKRFESKPFREIYREYSWNPIYVLIRLIRHLLAVWFGVIPADTDNPLYRKLRADRIAEEERKEQEKQIRTEMEVYYRKYAQEAKYQLRRLIEDYKFKRKKKLEAKNKPKFKYTPPKRTPEEQQAIDREMRRLYREYHVSWPEKLRRAIETHRQERKELRNSIKPDTVKAAQSPEESAEEQKSRGARIADWIIIAVTAVLLIFLIYVMVSAAHGRAVNVFGRSILRVETGSMEPTLHTGDYIFIKKTDPDSLQTGDIIAFYSEQSDIYDLLVTHRIAAVNADGTYVSRGDANPVSDSIAVRPERIVGIYTGKARFLIWVNSFVDMRKMLLLIVMISVLWISLYEVKSLIRLGKKAAEESEEEAARAHDEKIRAAIEKEKRRLAEIGYTPESEVNTVDAGEDHEETDDPGDHTV
ncbi:MAG: signal peptidase I [Oscillospiraceae bacterium]|nr:signal peptidase I [Oscillospiraceae bacterium]